MDAGSLGGQHRKPQHRHKSGAAEGSPARLPVVPGSRRPRSRARSTEPSRVRRLSAGVALATVTALSVVEAAPILLAHGPANSSVEYRSVQKEVRLASSSILNIPINLLIDIINIPGNEIEAIDSFSTAQIYGGTWWVSTASNIWGVDPADYARFASLVEMLVPITALSGADDDLYTGAGLAQQFAKFMAAEFPVDPACDAEGCAPNAPESPITGITAVDQVIWSALMLSGAVDMPVIRNLFKVSLSDLLSGYDFGAVVDPSGTVYSGLGISGTTDGDLMPWSNTTFTLDLVAPIGSFITQLMADPSDNAIELPDLGQIGRTMQTALAGIVVAFDPFTPGSPLCVGSCASEADSIPTIVQAISDLWPGNETLESWLQSYEDGTANVPTQDNVDNSNKLWQSSSFWDFSNPTLSDDLVNIGINPSSLASSFYEFWKSVGLNPDPLSTDESTAGTSSASAESVAVTTASEDAPSDDRTTPDETATADDASATVSASAETSAVAAAEPTDTGTGTQSTSPESDGKTSADAKDSEVTEDTDKGKPDTGKTDTDETSTDETASDKTDTDETDTDKADTEKTDTAATAAATATTKQADAADSSSAGGADDSGKTGKDAAS